MVKIANLFFNPFINDSRVEKISKGLSDAGYEVEVIANLDNSNSYGIIFIIIIVVFLRSKQIKSLRRIRV